jgi:DNA modification methylase
MAKNRRVHDQRGVIDKAAGRLAVVQRRIDELKLNPGNTRDHDDKQVAKIARSMETFGFLIPVLVDANLQVIAGHGRILAARKLGWTEIPTNQIEHLTEAQARAFAIADNRLCELAVWDDRALAEELKDLSLADLDFTLDVVGFETPEIDFRIQSLAETGAEHDTADDIADQPDEPPTSKVGDLWLLGKHRALNANALLQSSYDVLMNGEKAAVVISDAPYNCAIEGHVCGLGAIHHKDFAMAAGEMSKVEFTKFLTDAYMLMAKHSKDGSVHYQFMDWRHIEEITAAGDATYSALLNLCVWAKDNGGMGSFYRSQHELIFVFRNGRAAHRNNIQLGKYKRNRSNVWRYPGVNSFARKTDEGDLLKIHPTVKPVALIADAIMDSSMRGDLVLDGFLGAGSTTIAAERTGRRCYGIEIDSMYVDRLIRRWQRFSGQRAIHEPTGRLFDDISQAANNE